MSSMDTLKQEGEKIAKKLGLKKAEGYTEPNLRWEMGVFGTKTGIGVYDVIKRLADEARENIEDSKGEETHEWASHNPFVNGGETCTHD
jgi:hypothetical protein